MSVDLNKHKDVLLGAWKEVVDDKNPTNWAVFGYEKQSNSLTLVGTGDGGLEEITEELNVSKIMYAFCRVTDPNTSLIKFVFINWQGEGVQLSRKGTCANHVQDIANFFKPHITVNARTEDDVEPAIIMEKVAKSTSSFNFKERSESNDNAAPVGSVYERIQPAKEINPREREKFWMKEMEEEKRRIEEEKKKMRAEKDRLERERRDREASEAAKRERKSVEKSLSITETREAEHNAENTARNVRFEKMQWEKQLKEDARDEDDRGKRSESLRRERSQEAQQMISTRTINARSIFERNTCAGQMNSFNSSSTHHSSNRENNSPSVSHHSLSSSSSSSSGGAPPNLAPSALVKISPLYSTETSQLVRAANLEPDKSEMSINLDKDQNDQDQGCDVPSPAPPERPLPGSSEAKSASIQRVCESDFNYSRNLLKEGLPPRPDSEAEDDDQNWDEAPVEEVEPPKEVCTEMAPNREQSPNERTTVSNQGLRAKALYDYQAADETEISFDPDDLITHIEQIDEGWWQGMGPSGSYGLFPANYVELVD